MSFIIITLILAVLLLTVFAAAYLVYYLFSTEGVPTLAQWSGVWVLIAMIVLAILVFIMLFTGQPVPA